MLPSILVVAGANRDQPDLLLAQLDLGLIAWLEAKQTGVGHADQQVAVELDLGVAAQAAVTLAFALPIATVRAKADALGLQQRLIESGEVESLTAVLLGIEVADCSHQIGLGDLTQLLDLGE
jgi:hypothetical protein